MDDSSFISDEMCAWAYYMDFEEEELEIWTGEKMMCTTKFEYLSVLNLHELQKIRDEEIQKEWEDGEAEEKEKKAAAEEDAGK